MTNGRNRYRRKTTRRRSRYYLLLSLVLIFLLVKWGAPLLVEIIVKTGGKSVLMDEEDDIPPQSPILSALPEATNSGRIVVEGFTEAEVQVSVWLNGDLVGEETADNEGYFKTRINLNRGENDLFVTAKDEAGNESNSATKNVLFDNESVEVVIESPEDGTEFFGAQNERVEIKGTVNKEGVQVIINGFYVPVSDMTFVYRIKLNEGENKLKIRAQDKAGNANEKEMLIKYLR